MKYSRWFTGHYFLLDPHNHFIHSFIHFLRRSFAPKLNSAATRNCQCETAPRRTVKVRSMVISRQRLRSRPSRLLMRRRISAEQSCECTNSHLWETPSFIDLSVFVEKKAKQLRQQERWRLYQNRVFFFSLSVTLTHTRISLAPSPRNGERGGNVFAQTVTHPIEPPLKIRLVSARCLFGSALSSHLDVFLQIQHGWGG